MGAPGQKMLHGKCEFREDVQMKTVVFLVSMSLFFVFTATVEAEVIYTENFNDGLSPEWLLWNNQGNPLGIFGYNGQLELLTVANELLNEAYFMIDLTGFTDITLSFNYGTNSEEVAQSLPATFMDHYLGDGVSYTIDGMNWITLVSSFPATPFYMPMAPVSVSMPPEAIFLKFQQYGATSTVLGSICIDDIVIEGTNNATGSLNVSISPPDAVSAGAQWRRTETTPWFNSGDTETGIPTGSYEVQFKSIDGWLSPLNQFVIISDGATTSISCAYVEKTYYSGGTGVSTDPYQIASVDNWLELISSSDDWNKHFILTSDIDFTGAFLTPVGGTTAFQGVFDGNDHVLRNFGINQAEGDSVGVFGRLGHPGQIRNLGIEDVYIAGDEFVGGLVGTNQDGLIYTCYVTGSVSGTRYVGGIAGMCEGYQAYIKNCYVTASVSGTGDPIGGLAGYLFWAEIHDSYACGVVSGSQDAGGLVGYSEIEDFDPVNPEDPLMPVEAPWLVNNSFWDIQTSGMTSSSGGTGETTTQMQRISTFRNAGWDFTTAWGIGNSQTYPYLKSFNGMNPADIDYSGTVNLQDFAIIATNWLSQE
jgi:hypothetical protein